MPDREYSEQGELPLFETSLEPPASLTTGEIHRCFAGWNKPLLESACDFLTKRWDGKTAIDLTDTLIVVPSRNAGRRLRETLAIRAAEKDAAVFPPLVVTPDYLFSPERIPSQDNATPLAGSRTAQWIWTALLLKVPLHEFRRVFPVDPVERSFHWASETVSELLAVKRLLVEAEHSFATAAEVLSDHDMEPARWAELAELERLAERETAELGFDEESKAQIAAARNGILPDSVKNIVVCGAPDLRPIAATALHQHSQKLSLTILIHAPESEAGSYDEFGRPLPSAWMDREIDIPHPESSIIRSVSPLEQATTAVDRIVDLKETAGSAAIGIPDTALSVPVSEALLARGLKGYDPGGLALAGEGIFYLLKLTSEIVSTQSFSSFRKLLNCPGIAAAMLRLHRDKEESITATRLIRSFDDLIVRTMPDRLDDARSAAKRQFSKQPELGAAIDWMKIWCKRFRDEPFDATIRDYLIEIYEGRKFAASHTTQAMLSEVADAILTLAEDSQRTAAAFPAPLSEKDHFEMLLSSLSTLRIYPDREPDEIDLQGWLELLWEDAPRLVITGMNDHAVPEAIAGHAFLPDTARRALGIPNNDDRFARDAYFLTSILESRKQPGSRVDLIFGRESASGDPLRPSRLLFQCPPAELPDRTLQLFSDLEIENQPEARSVAFQLLPQKLDPENFVFQRLSPTAIKQYLACPFRFYLSRGLGMNQVEINKREMDAADFGNLVHNSLEAFALDDNAKTLTDPAEIRTYLHGEIDRQISAQFGNQLPTPLVIQRESARKRLGWWAKLEAQHRAEGWVITGAEDTFGVEDWPFEINGMTIKGRIDRVEEHPEHGIRVIDFKTFSPGSGSSRKTVDKYHLTAIKRTEDPDDFADWLLVEDEKGKAHRWSDLQLPLYALAMREREPDKPITAAYATLGKSEAEIALDTWDTLDENLLTKAKQCAIGVIEAIRSEQFWPPSEDAPPWDEFRDLLAPTPSEAIDPTGLRV